MCNNNHMIFLREKIVLWIPYAPMPCKWVGDQNDWTLQLTYGGEKIIKIKSYLKTPKSHALLPCILTAVPQSFPSSSCVLLTPLSSYNTCVSPQMSFSSALPHSARFFLCSELPCKPHKPQLLSGTPTVLLSLFTHAPAIGCSASNMGTICPWLKEKAAEALMLFLPYLSVRFE